jgi:hypothetical protein
MGDNTLVAFRIRLLCGDVVTIPRYVISIRISLGPHGIRGCWFERKVILMDDSVVTGCLVGAFASAHHGSNG